MCRKLIAICLAGFVLCSPLWALDSPPPSSSGVWLSDAEAAEQAAMEAAIVALDQSSQTIAKQEKDLKRLYWLCGALVVVLAVDATAEIIEAVKR